jgi:hypothetical protein
MRHDRVPIPAKVMEGLEAVRLSGKTNMLDVPVVAYLALEMGYPQTAIWVVENKKFYAQGIFRGFDPIEGLGDSERETAEDTSGRKGGDEECVD